MSSFGANLRVIDIDWHPEGHQLASVSRAEQTVRIWDITTGAEISAFEAGEPNSKGVFNQSIAWSPDGERLATSGSGGIEIRDRVGWRQLHQIHGPSNNLAWNQDGRYLAAGPKRSGKSVKIFDSFTGRSAWSLVGHSGSVQIGGWSADDRRIATAGLDGMRLWNSKTGQELFSLPGAKSMAWSHDGKKIATIEEGKVRIYDASLGYKIATDSTYLTQRAMGILDEAFALEENGKYGEAIQRVETAVGLASILSTSSEVFDQVADRVLAFEVDVLREKREFPNGPCDTGDGC